MEKKTQVYIKQIALKDYKCFKGENVFSFVHNTDDGKFQAYQWTVLLEATMVQERPTCLKP